MNKLILYGGVALGVVLSGNIVTNVIAGNVVADKVAQFNQVQGKEVMTIGNVSHWLLGNTTIENVAIKDSGVVINIAEVVASEDGDIFDLLSLSDIHILGENESLDIKISELNFKDVDIVLLQKQLSQQSAFLGSSMNDLMTVINAKNQHKKRKAVLNLQNAQTTLLRDNLLTEPAYKSVQVDDIELNMPMLNMALSIGEIVAEYGDELMPGLPKSATIALNNLTLPVPTNLKYSNPILAQLFAQNEEINFSIDGNYNIDDDTVKSSVSVVEENLAKLSFNYDFADINTQYAKDFIKQVSNPKADAYQIMNHPMMKNLHIEKISFDIEERGAITKMLAPFKANPQMLQQQIDMLAMQVDAIQPGLGSQFKTKLMSFVDNPESISMSISQNAGTELNKILEIAKSRNGNPAALIQAFTFNIQ